MVNLNWSDMVLNEIGVVSAMHVRGHSSVMLEGVGGYMPKRYEALRGGFS